MTTGLELLEIENGGVQALDGANWRQRQRKLQDYGGVTESAPLPSPSPKLETDFSRSITVAIRGRQRAANGRLAEALDDFTQAIELAHDSPILRTQIASWSGMFAEDAGNSHRQTNAREKWSRNAVAILEGLVNDFPAEPEYRAKLNREYCAAH